MIKSVNNSILSLVLITSFLFISSECLTKDDLVNGKVVNDGGLLKIYGVENADFVVSNYNGVLKKNGENSSISTIILFF